MRDKFGVQGLRVFQLLIDRGQLEQKQIGDLAMMQQKDVRELLYRMLKAGYVALQVGDSGFVSGLIVPGFAINLIAQLLGKNDLLMLNFRPTCVLPLGSPCSLDAQLGAVSSSSSRRLRAAACLPVGVLLLPFIMQFPAKPQVS